MKTLAPRIAIALGALLLAACAARPPVAPPPPESAPAPSPVIEGEVMARNERIVVYKPVAGETLATIAARLLGSADKAWMIADFNDIRRPVADEPLVVPLRMPNPMGVRADRYQTVPILCYHRFGTGTSKSTSTSRMVVGAADFAAQLDWLARNDYHVLRLADLSAFLDGKRAMPSRSVVITIDDGYESVHRIALPLLRAHGFPATVFVYTDFIGARDGLSWAQLQEMEASGLIDVESHSKTHRNLLDRAPGEADDHYLQMLDSETRGSRDLLEKRLDAPVRLFAFPYGDANQTVLDRLARDRYVLGVTVTPGGNPFFAHPMMLRRTMIFGDLDLAAFQAKLQTSQSYRAP